MRLVAKTFVLSAMMPYPEAVKAVHVRIVDFVKQTADLTYAQASGVDFNSIAEKIREKNAK